MTSYRELLRDPRWQRRRLEVMSRADFKCEKCGDAKSELNVHHSHGYRSSAMPWEYPDSELECLCKKCHEREHGIIPYDPNRVFPDTPKGRADQLFYKASGMDLSFPEKAELAALLRPAACSQ